MSSPTSPVGRCPLAGLALVIVSGTAAGICFHAPLPLLLPLSCLATLLTLFFYRRNNALIFLLCGVFFAAWINASMHEHNPSPAHLSALTMKPREHMEVVGIIADDPVILREGDRERELRQFTLRVSAVRRAGEWQRASGSVSVSWRAAQIVPQAEYGQEWKLRGILSRDSVRHSGFWAGPACRFRVDEGDELLLAEGKGNRFIRYCLIARRICATRLEAGVENHPDSHGLVKAMLLGYRGDLSRGLREAFSVTGTLHVLAVSGLHVGILAILLIGLVRACGISIHRSAWFMVPVLIFYAVLTGLRASAVRASIMAAVLVLASLFRRRPNALTAIAVAASLILVACPGQLVDAGFIFSFVAVIGLLILQPRIMRRWGVVEKLSEPWALQGPPFLYRMGRWSVLALCGTAATSLAVWLVTTPLTIRWFHLCSPIALLGNLLVIPLAFVVILTGVLSVVLGALHPVVAEIFNHANRIFVEWLLLWVGGLARVPGGYFRVGALSDAWLFCWYLFLFLLITAKGFLRKLLWPCAGVMIAVALASWWSGRALTRVVLIEASDSSAVLVDGPGARDILVNAGPAYRAHEMVSALQKRGVNGLEALVLAHADSAHAGGALDVMRSFPVRAVWCSPWVDQSPVCRAVLREAEERGIPIRRLVAGDRGKLGDAEWEVLHPSASSKVRRSADGALVMRIARRGGAVLMMSGADATVEQSILGGVLDPAAEVLITGGRRMGGTCSKEWLDAVRPRVALVGTGAGSRWVEPDRDALMRLAESGADVLRTEKSGTVEVVMGSKPEWPGGAWCGIKAGR